MADQKVERVDNDILSESAWLTDGKKMFRMAVLAAIFGPIGFGAAGLVSYMTARITGQWEKIIVPWTLKPTLDYLVSITPPPKALDFDTDLSAQLGKCTTDACSFQLFGARTEYGATCGNVVDVYGQLKIEGQKIIDFPYSDEFEPVTLGLLPEAFVVPLDLQSYVPVGTHQWRGVVTFENCMGPREPIPRETPWFPLTVTK